MLAPGSVPGARRAGAGPERPPGRGQEPGARRGRRAAARLGGAPASAAARENDVDLARDEFASSNHARVEPRRDGVWVEDVGSTNGTYVNGVRADRTRNGSTPGDILRVGETELRYETMSARLRARERHRHRAAGAGTTRTPTSASRRCSRSPTGWAARRPASSRRGSRPRRCATRPPSSPAARSASTTLIQEANRRVYERAVAGRVRLRDGHDDDGRARRGRPRRDRPRRRLARLPHPRRQARAADRGPLAGRRARPQRQALARGGRGPPAALGDHARARHRPGRRRRHLLGRDARPATSSCSARTG